jgi:hypothetical protein
MDRLSETMKQLIRDYSAGAVASVNADGSPSVSPKATFVIVDDKCIAYGNIRSPGTSRNLRERPAVEVSFVDVLARLAVRVSGSAELVARDSDRGRRLLPHFEAAWSPYLDLMQEFVCISVVSAELITSPAYDVGLKRDELVKANLEKLSKLTG